MSVPVRNPPYIAVVSDFRDGWPPASTSSQGDLKAAWRAGLLGPAPAAPPADAQPPEVLGGYLERLPLACARAGLVAHAEIWTGWRAASPAPVSQETAHLTRRAFPLDADETPFRSRAMVAFVEAFGAPKVLCVWGLGVDAPLLDACADSLKVYNSIDAPAVRIAPELLRRFDLVLTGADWQSQEVARIAPGLVTAVLPIGPEFADRVTFRPLDVPKTYDLVYVAAAQAYKRHDILFNALASASRPLSALCVFGYGELADTLRAQAARRGLAVEFVGPPGVGFDAVNALMNRARVGVVCGEQDGAPAILTEYMLAGLPVLANARLCCGLQYITPRTGLAAPAESFGEAAVALSDRAASLDPRTEVLRRWTWPHSVERLARALDQAERRRVQ